MLDRPDQLRLSSWRDGRTTMLHAAGELDILTAPRLLDLVGELLAGDVTEVVLDGAGLLFVDSAGLRALVVAHEQAMTRGVDLRVGAASDALRTVLAVTGLDRLLRPPPELVS